MAVEGKSASGADFDPFNAKSVSLAERTRVRLYLPGLNGSLWHDKSAEQEEKAKASSSSTNVNSGSINPQAGGTSTLGNAGAAAGATSRPTTAASDSLAKANRKLEKLQSLVRTTVDDGLDDNGMAEEEVLDMEEEEELLSGDEAADGRGDGKGPASGAGSVAAFDRINSHQHASTSLMRHDTDHVRPKSGLRPTSKGGFRQIGSDALSSRPRPPAEPRVPIWERSAVKEPREPPAPPPPPRVFKAVQTRVFRLGEGLNAVQDYGHADEGALSHLADPHFGSDLMKASQHYQALVKQQLGRGMQACKASAVAQSPDVLTFDDSGGAPSSTRAMESLMAVQAARARLESYAPGSAGAGMGERGGGGAGVSGNGSSGGGINAASSPSARLQHRLQQAQRALFVSSDGPQLQPTSSSRSFYQTMRSPTSPPSDVMGRGAPSPTLVKSTTAATDVRQTSSAGGSGGGSNGLRNCHGSPAATMKSDLRHSSPVNGLRSGASSNATAGAHSSAVLMKASTAMEGGGRQALSAGGGSGGVGRRPSAAAGRTSIMPSRFEMGPNSGITLVPAQTAKAAAVLKALRMS